MSFRLLLFLAASAIFYAAERFATLSTTAFTLASLFWAASLLLEYRELKFSGPEEKPFLRTVLAYRALFLLGITTYLLGQSFSTTGTKLPLVLQLFAYLILGLSFVWGVGIELIASRKRQYSGDDVNARSKASLSLGFLLVTLISLNFVAKKTDLSFDASYLKTSQAGAASRASVARLKEPVRVGLFFSRESDVLPYIRDYFESFDKLPLKVEIFDKDINPTQAEEFRVARNGQIVLMLGEKRQRFEIGDKLDEAKRNLKTLDASFLKALLQLTSVPTTIYFTSTHGEMLWESGTPVRSMAIFEEMLRGLNYRARRLTSLFQDVPPEAKVVGIIGPSSDFTDDEIKTLDRYLQGGGRLFIALDIDSQNESGARSGQPTLIQYLASLGIRYNTSAVAHDQKFVTLARDKSDRTFLYSNVFANHPSVATASLSPERMTFMSHRTGSFDLLPASDWKSLAVVQSMNGSFRDANGNFDPDPNEKKASFPLVVAAESAKGARLVVYGDATSLSNTLMKVAANQLVAIDAMRWLSDRTEDAGAVANEEDVLIRQEKSRETLVFYGSIFLLPFFVLLAGFVVMRRTKSKGGKG